MLPHTGRDKDGNDVALAQWIVRVDGRFVGYAGHKPTDGIALIRPVSESEKRMIEVAVAQKKGVNDMQSDVIKGIGDGNSK